MRIANPETGPGFGPVRRAFRFFVILAMLAPLLSAQPALAQRGSPGYRPGRLLVRHAGDSEPSGVTRSSALRDLDRRFGLISRRGLGEGASARPALARAERPTAAVVRTTEVLEFDPAADVEAIALAYGALPGVLAAEPDYRASLATGPLLTPTDPGFANQLGDYDLVGFREAWGQQTGLPSVIVAVIDSGCDEDHVDLIGHISPMKFDFVSNDSDVTDDQGHGTRVCSIIGASANNGTGMAGSAFGVTILPLDVVDDFGGLYNSEVILAVDYAVAQGAHVINMSFTFSSFSQLLADSLALAAPTAVLVAAVGNDNNNSVKRYPASYPEVVGVAAAAEGGMSRASFSNYNGENVTMADLSAPGETLFSAFPGDQFDMIFGNGTSLAAPLVSGAAALLTAQNPAQAPGAIVNHLFATADPGALSYTNKGFLKAGTALCTPMVPSLVIEEILVEDTAILNAANNNDGATDIGETVNLNLLLRNWRADATGVTVTLSNSDGTVIVTDNAGGYPDIPYGLARLPINPIAIDTTDPIGLGARRIPLRLTVNADGGFSTFLDFEIQIEEKLPVPSSIAGLFTFNSNKTYIIDQPTVVPPGAVLTIQPGAVVRFVNGMNSSLTIQGTLAAVGSAALPILFTGAPPGSMTGYGTPHGGISVGMSGSANFAHCRFEFGPLSSQSPNTNLSDAGFFETGGSYSLTLAGGSVPVERVRVEGNPAGGGIMAPARDFTDCVALYNAGDGINGYVLNDIRSIGNDGRGIVCGMVQDGLARDNTGNGIEAMFNVINSTAIGNGAYGVVCQSAVGVTSEGNMYGGIDAYGGATNCVATGNGDAGIISFGATILNSRSLDNQGAAMYADYITDSAGAHNGDGVSADYQITGSYIAEHDGGEVSTGVFNGDVIDSAVINHPGSGVRFIDLVSNSWLVGNGSGANSVGAVDSCTIVNNWNNGVFGRTSPPYTTIMDSILMDNGINGFYNAGPVRDCILINNGTGFEYSETRSFSTLPEADLTGNYWGPAMTAQFIAHPFGSGFNHPEIYDFYDNNNRTRANYGGHLATAPLTAGADLAAPTFLFSVSPPPTVLLGAEKTTFTLTFSEPMNTTIGPKVTFGYDPPYTAHLVTADPGWISPTQWQGCYPIEDTIASGIHTLRVEGAVDAGGFEIPYDTAHYIEIAVSGALVANNGIASVISASQVDVAWTGAAGGLGAQTKGFDVTRSATGAPGTYTKINGTPLPNNFILTYPDNALSPSTQYWWNIYRVDLTDNSTIWSGPVTATTILGPSPTPASSPSPAGSPTPTPAPSPSVAASPSPTPVPSSTPTAAPSVTVTATPVCCPGDANNSGSFVDAIDFIAVQANFGADNGVGGPGDADCSGSFVDATDFIAVQANFGADCD